MTNNVDDVHSFDTGFIRSMERIEALQTTQKNYETINSYNFKFLMANK
jgi:hypothetical protein